MQATSPLSTGTAGQISDEADVVYCVAAIIDLLGFSAHLEVGAYDMRTTVGRAAVERLRILEDALSLVRKERVQSAQAYPSGLGMARINDSIVLTMDLPERLKPGIGEPHRRGYSANELAEHFEIDAFLEDDSSERFVSHFLSNLQSDVRELAMFLGLVARLHGYISEREADHAFPGAKTICSTGFRRRFTAADGFEDFLAANFAFANAHIADGQLHGPHLFVEDGVSALLFIDPIARNILRFAAAVPSLVPFEFTEEPRDGFVNVSKYVLATPERVVLFRKEFFFRPIDARPTTHLQTIDALRPLITDDRIIPRSIFSYVRKHLAQGPELASLKEGVVSQRLLFSVDLTFPLGEYLEIATTGKSR